MAEIFEGAPLGVYALIAFAVALAASALGVPVVRSIARALRIVDSPDPERKLHHGEIALCGGVAVFFASLAALAAVLILHQRWGAAVLEWDRRWLSLLVAAAGIVLLGLVDDWITLRGRQKLLGQVLIVCFVAASGTALHRINVFGYDLELGAFAMPITVLWLLGAVNALNLIDGADGMATTTGAIIAAGLAAMAMMTGMPLAGLVALSMAGALLGFLIYNRPPASIFLGDAGSMLIGLVVGVLAIWSSLKGSTVLAVAPLVALSVPLFDSSIAILRRVLTGRSIYSTDRAHLHHRLLTRFSHRRMLAIVAVLCGLTTSAAVLSVALNQQWIAAGGAAVVLGSLVLTRSFGNAELKMLAMRTAHFGESMLTRSGNSPGQVHQKCTQLQGSRRWDTIWSSLVEYAYDHQLSSLSLDLNIAWMHEGYHGSWRRSRLPDKTEQLVLKMPVMAGDRQVGHLEIIGDGCRAGAYESLETLVARLQDLQPQIERLLSEITPPAVDPAKIAATPSAPLGLPPRAATATHGPSKRLVDLQPAHHSSAP